MVASVDRVRQFITDISSATLEQSAGIEQVNTAVTQMDQTTQQNAALVEEAAAAAKSMEEQAQSLSSTVARFRIEKGNQTTPISKPPARAQRSPARAALKSIGASSSQPRLVASQGRAATAVASAGEADDAWQEF
jgi:hypothetical protein